MVKAQHQDSAVLLTLPKEVTLEGGASTSSTSQLNKRADARRIEYLERRLQPIEIDVKSRMETAKRQEAAAERHVNHVRDRLIQHCLPLAQKQHHARNRLVANQQQYLQELEGMRDKLHRRMGAAEHRREEEKKSRRASSAGPPSRMARSASASAMLPWTPSEAPDKWASFLREAPTYTDLRAGMSASEMETSRLQGAEAAEAARAEERRLQGLMNRSNSVRQAGRGAYRTRTLTHTLTLTTHLSPLTFHPHPQR